MAIEAVVEPLIGVVAGILEAFAYTLAACTRSFRYLFSSSYRQRIRVELSGRGPLYRAAYLLWGLLFTAFCLAVVLAIVYWLTADPTPSSACSDLDAGKALDSARALKSVLAK